MNVLKAVIAGAAIGLSACAMAQQQEPSEHRLVEHPAVTVKRLSEGKGYDYASKFYPHPAGLQLYPASPSELDAGQAKRQVAETDSLTGEASARR